MLRGAFGISLSRPYRTTLCGPFWAAVLGCTVGLPIVLFGWTIRLIFGKGRTKRMWDTVGGWTRSPVGKFLEKIIWGILITVTIVLTSAVLAAVIYRYGWLNVGLGIMAIAGIIGLILFLLLPGASALDEKYREWKRNRPPRPPKPQKKRGRILPQKGCGH